MTLSVQVEREEDGRWIAEVVELPGALAYAVSADAAIAKAQALALGAVSERLEHGEIDPQLVEINFVQG